MSGDDIPNETQDVELPPPTLSHATLVTATMDLEAREASRLESLSGPPTIPGYQLEERLGAGSFGEVWSAVQLATHQKVAVKLLRRRTSQKTHLEREVTRLGSVAEHPNIVTLLDANLDHDPAFLVTPLLSGSIESWLKKRVDTPTAVRAFEQMALALRTMHGKGILHCDLKPANVLLDSSQDVRIVDFGQAHMLDEGGLSLGTFWYMAPEQALVGDSAPDVAWDIYALGATIYQLLTGRLPRDTESGRRLVTGESDTLRALENYRQHLHQQALVPIRRLNPAIDPDLAAIVEHCLVHDPAGRYRDVGDILEDLRRRRERRPLTAVRRTPGYVFTRFVARYPLPCAFVVVLAVLLAHFVHGLDVARRQAQKRLAEVELQRGRGLLDRADATGLLWLAQAVQDTPDDSTRPAVQELCRELWTRPRLQLFVEQQSPVRMVRLAPDDRLLLTLGADHAVRFWDVKLRKPVGPKVFLGATTDDVVFSADGRLVAAANQRQVCLWTPGNQPLPGHSLSADVQKLAFSVQGSLLACAAADGGVTVLRADGQPLATWQESAPVLWLRWSPQDTRLLVVTGRTAVLRDGATGHAIARLTSPVPFTSATFSPDGAFVAVGSADGMIYLADRSGHVPQPLHHGDGPHQGKMVQGLRFFGRSLLTAGQEPTAHLYTLDAHGQFRGVGLLLNDPSWMITGNSQSPVVSMDAAPNGTRVVTAYDHLVQFWDVHGHPVGVPLAHPDPVEQVAFSPDGTQLMTVTNQLNVELWQANNGQPRMIMPMSANTSATFSPSGRLLAIAGLDGVQVWDVAPRPPASGADVDEPAALLTVEAELASASRLDHEDVHRLDAAECRALLSSWDEEGRQHYTLCADKDANLWHALSGLP